MEKKGEDTGVEGSKYKIHKLCAWSSTLFLNLSLINNIHDHGIPVIETLVNFFIYQVPVNRNSLLIELPSVLTRAFMLSFSHQSYSKTISAIIISQVKYYVSWNLMKS